MCALKKQMKFWHKVEHCSKKRSKKVWWIFLADLNVDCFARSRRIWTNPVSFGAVFHAV